LTGQEPYPESPGGGGQREKVEEKERIES